MEAVLHILEMFVILYFAIGIAFAIACSWALSQQGARYRPFVWVVSVFAVACIWILIVANAVMRYMDERRERYLENADG